MQTDDVDFGFTPLLADTSSLMTPNIVLNGPSTKSSFSETVNELATNSDISSRSNPSSIMITESEPPSNTSTADVKVTKIEDELKRSLMEARQPTPSPFQKISSSNTIHMARPAPAMIMNEDVTATEAPSTADVVKVLESLTNTNPLPYIVKTSSNDNPERDIGTRMNGDNMRYESSAIINVTNVSPKKKLLIRSQSRTEPTSPIQSNNNNNMSPSQKYNNDFTVLNTQNALEDENSIDDPINTHYIRPSDLPTFTHSNDINIDNNNQQFKAMIDNGHEQHLNIPLKTDQNITSHTSMKQQPITLNHINNNNMNKRPMQQANIGNHMSTLSKTNTVIIPQPSLNEVTSTDQLSGVKRQRTVSMPINGAVMNFRSSFPSSSSSAAAAGVATGANTSITANGANLNGGSEEQRKKQIRDSNREAARRCRERRRQYIEQLEGNLEQYKTQIKQMTEKLGRVERENTQLRAILSETKILHQASRIPINDSHVDYGNVVSATGMDLNSDPNHQIDGRTMQRSYIDRNNL